MAAGGPLPPGGGAPSIGLNDLGGPVRRVLFLVTLSSLSEVRIDAVSPRARRGHRMSIPLRGAQPVPVSARTRASRGARRHGGWFARRGAAAACSPRRATCRTSWTGQIPQVPAGAEHPLRRQVAPSLQSIGGHVARSWRAEVTRRSCRSMGPAQGARWAAGSWAGPCARPRARAALPDNDGAWRCAGGQPCADGARRPGHHGNGSASAPRNPGAPRRPGRIVSWSVV